MGVILFDIFKASCGDWRVQEKHGNECSYDENVETDKWQYNKYG